MNEQKKLNKNHSHLYMMGVTSHSYLSVGQGIKMKFTAEQIEYLERVIDMDGLDITQVKTHIKGNVLGNVLGDVGGNVEGDVEGFVEGFVWGTVKGEEVI